MTENWYLVLELEFDPHPVNDEAIIAERIEEMRKFWLRKSNDLNHGSEYRKYVQMIPQIKKDMLGQENIRATLVKDAVEKVYGTIDKTLELIKTTDVTVETLEKIAAKHNVGVKIVERRAAALGIQIGTTQGEEYQEIYDKFYGTKPQNADKFSSMNVLLKSFHVSNLYEFLYNDVTIEDVKMRSCNELRNRAKEKKVAEFYKNDAISGSGAKLCAWCEECFQDEASKNIYDTYLEYYQRKNILDELKEIYDLVNSLTAEAYADCMEKLTEALKDAAIAEKVLVAFCKVEQIPIPEHVQVIVKEVPVPQEQQQPQQTQQNVQTSKRKGIPYTMVAVVAIVVLGLVFLLKSLSGADGVDSEDINSTLASADIASTLASNEEDSNSYTENEENYAQSEEIENNEAEQDGLAIGKYIYFGHYEQEREISITPIEWLVLDVEDDKVLLLSRYVLDCQPYHLSAESVTWEMCSLRNWLNDTFYNTAFYLNEQEAILTTLLRNDDNGEVDGGNDTEDKVFLLSIEDIYKYFPHRKTINQANTTRPTQYAMDMGAYALGYTVSNPYWLRSPGYNHASASFASVGGGVNDGGTVTNEIGYGVRPAVWVDLSALSEIAQFSHTDSDLYVASEGLVQMFDADLYQAPISVRIEDRHFQLPFSYEEFEEKTGLFIQAENEMINPQTEATFSVFGEKGQVAQIYIKNPSDSEVLHYSEGNVVGIHIAFDEYKNMEFSYAGLTRKSTEDEVCHILEEPIYDYKNGTTSFYEFGLDDHFVPEKISKVSIGFEKGKMEYITIRYNGD